MKRNISMVLAALFLAVLLGACGQESAVPESVEQADQIHVICTIFPPYDFVREIAGDLVSVEMLLPPGGESHSFEPSPRDITKIRDCDVFIYVGGHSDAWVQKVLDNMDTSDMKIIALMDCVDVVTEEIVEGMEHEHGDDHEHADEDHEHADEDHDHADEDHEHEHEHEEPEYDEHVWTSPKNAKTIVEKISELLCQADEKNEKSYRENTSSYLAELDALDLAFREVVDQGQRKTLIFGDRFPFRYFADAYGLDYFAAFPGCSTQTEANAATIAFLIEKIRSENIPVVFHVELSGMKMVNILHEETAAEVLLFHACHNVTQAEMDAGANYLDIMRQNVENLRTALS